MSRKAPHLVVDLEIQAVTCPGVWLCPNGNVQLLFSMLGQEVQTKRLPPVFPLLFHEKLTFQKTFPNAGCLAEVQDSLSREDVYAVLLQEVEDPSGGAAVQLARFHSNALHILYPSPCAKGLLAGVDVDLLMEASADYPGILCPKIELSTKTVVKEITSPVQEGYIINPKTLSSQKMPLLRSSGEGDVRTVRSDGRSRMYSSHQIEKGKKARHNQAIAHKLGHCRSTPSATQNQRSQSAFSGHPSGHLHCTGKCGLPDTASDCQELCQCGTGHSSSKCPLCAQYRAMFNTVSDSPDPFQGIKTYHTDVCCKKQATGGPFERSRRLSKALHDHVDHILEPTFSNILHNRGHLDSYLPLSQSQPNYGSSYKKHSEDQFAVNEEPKKLSKSSPCFQVSCGSGDEYNSHRQLFYSNLEKFYRKLYDRAKSRAQGESDLGGSEC